MKTEPRGFSMVEIMIVLTLIAMLAALALPALGRVRASAQDKAVLNNARQLATAADQYFLEYGVTVARFTDLVGPGCYIRNLPSSSHEIYPAAYVQGTPIIVTEIGGVRTLQYGQ